MNNLLRVILLSALFMDTFGLVALAKNCAAECPSDLKLSADMPILLGVGTTRTPAFTVKHKRYLIEIRAQWNMPTDELKCKMGFELSPGYPVCRSEPLIEAEWSVWDGERVVAHGIDKGRSHAYEAGACYFGRFLGDFDGESGHKYSVEVKIIKDASLLNVTNPRLVVTIVTGNAF